MQRGFLSEETLLTVEAPVATGTTVVDSTALDMQDWDGVIWIVRIGTPGADRNIRAQQDTVVGMGAAADLAGTLVNSATNNVHVLDLKRPSKRFVRCRITRGTTTTVDTLIAIRYRGRKRGVAQASTVTIERHLEVAEGTA